MTVLFSISVHVKDSDCTCLWYTGGHTRGKKKYLASPQGLAVKSVYDRTDTHTASEIQGGTRDRNMRIKTSRYINNVSGLHVCMYLCVNLCINMLSLSAKGSPEHMIRSTCVD